MTMFCLAVITAFCNTWLKLCTAKGKNLSTGSAVHFRSWRDQITEVGVTWILCFTIQ